MAYRRFEGKKYSSIHQQQRSMPTSGLKDIITLGQKGTYHLSHLQKGHLHVGCGTGQHTRLLELHFKEMVGIDISDFQMEEAWAANIPYWQAKNMFRLCRIATHSVAVSYRQATRTNGMSGRFHSCKTEDLTGAWQEI
ncbi:hypothetical protein CCH79_00002985 [Gambusia affinis]|uniref:Methyltransferase type 11 domain-containing protein n=1 Tax=Gambusia affinis TaxID=33528 RepID=A0A315W933_GAMAF|nr:hypothetical protein CCH79_00002985 [Gambusia affinis]